MQTQQLAKGLTAHTVNAPDPDGDTCKLDGVGQTSLADEPRSLLVECCHGKDRAGQCAEYT